MAADARRVKELFGAALDIHDPRDRDAFLDRECADNPDLRQRLDVLLRAHDQPESALERPLASPAATATFAPNEPTVAHTPSEIAGTLLAGRYKLLERIGEGGMGEVWVAEQTEPIKRRVALKLIKPGMDSRAVLARFEAERQALALMDHPNIAKVLDAGTTDDGRPYFVMELVKGTPITAFCDERRLSTRERLELFVPVCQAIQHAHQKGIIHRDIKPSNVLVALHDEKAVPKVIDFGVAKAIGQQLTEKTLYTGFGSLVGTPAYMAPEQATFNQLDVDTRADVYALGVLLYELLAGSPPFEPERLKKAALDEILRLVREEEPPRPSARLSTSQAKATIAAVRHTEPSRLANLLRGELDWIVMKALEKDRTRRYETANGFAMDVQRYLTDEPVQACPPSAGYRLRKFARRNKAALSLAATVIASLLITMFVLGFSYLALVAEQKKTEQAKNQVTESLETAERLRLNLADSLGKAAMLSHGHGDSLCHSGQTGIGLLWQAAALNQLPPGNANYDRLIRLNLGAWIRAMPELRGVIPRNSFVRSCFTSDGSRLIVCEQDRIHVWSVRACRPACPAFPVTGTVEGLILTADSRTLVGLTHDEARNSTRIQFWDLLLGQLRHEAVVPEGESWGQAQSITPDGKCLVTSVSTGENKVQLQAWNLATGTMQASRDETAGHPIAIGYTKSGNALVTFRQQTDTGYVFAVRRWDIDANQWVGERNRFAVPNGLDGGITNCFTPGADRVLTRNGETEVTLRDLATGKPCGPSIPRERINTAHAFSADGTRLITVGTEAGSRRAWIWALDSGQIVGELGTTAAIETLLASPSGPTLLTISIDRTATLWDTGRGERLGRSISPASPIRSAAFSPDGKLVATGCADGSVQLWDARTGEPVGSPISHAHSVGDVAFSPDGQHFYTRESVGPQGVIRLWALPASVMNAGRRYPTGTVAIDLDRGRFALGRFGHFFPTEAIVHDAASGKAVSSPLVHDRGFRGASFSPDGRVLAILTGPQGGASVASDGAVNFWEIASSRLLGRSPITEGLHFLRPPAFNPDGKLVATCNTGGLVQVWEVPTGRLVTPPGLMHGNKSGASTMMILECTAFSPDGRLLATGGWDQCVRLWDTKTWEARGVLRHPAAVMGVAFDESGGELASASVDGRVRRWNIETGTEMSGTLVQGGSLTSVAFHQDFLAAGGNRSVQLWDRKTEQRVGPPVSGTGTSQIRFSRDGRSLASWGNGPGREVPLPQPLAGEPKWILRHVELMTGYELGANGEPRPLGMESWLSRKEELEGVGFQLR